MLHFIGIRIANQTTVGESSFCYHSLRCLMRRVDGRDRPTLAHIS
ncbi:hypothetical protein [Vacuolonema iberomarrocanum]